jgi:hypothetical protein
MIWKRCTGAIENREEEIRLGVDRIRIPSAP